MSYGNLLKSPRFQCYLWTQFLGAFNDNVTKLIVILTALNAFPGDGSVPTSLVSALFVLPFLFFSGWAGTLSDKAAKHRVMSAMKAFEIVVMVLGLACLVKGYLPGLFAVVFLMGIHSTFFGPAKYGILPEFLPDGDLSRANGLLEMTTFMAIVLGTAVGGTLYTRWEGHPQTLGAVLVAIAVVGWLFSLGLPRVAPAGGASKVGWNPFGGLGQGLTELKASRPLWLTVLGLSFFWFTGALIQQAVVLLGKETLGLPDGQITLLITALAVGVGFGSLLAGRLSGDKVELGLVPLGSVGMGVFAVLLGLFPRPYGWCLTALALIGFFGGFFAVPLNAYLQQKADTTGRGRLMAVNNLLNTVGMILSSVMVWGLGHAWGWSADRLILVTGFLTLGAAVYITTLLPEALIRFILLTLTHGVYRVKVVNASAVPTEGPALLVCNHVSHVDGLLIGTSVQRPIRFMVWKPYTELWYLRWLFRLMDAIPTSNRTPRESLESIERAREALKRGEAVCIFAEGAISRTGNLHPFKRGFERIVEGLDVPIVPVHLDNLWGSVFSFKEGRFFFKKPEKFPYPVTLSFGPPLKRGVSSEGVRLAVMELGADAWEHRRKDNDTLARRLVATAQKYPFRIAVSDTLGKRLTYSKYLAAAILLARWIKRERPEEPNVGVQMPASVGGSLANAAVTLAGRCSVNVNFTLGPDVLASAAERSGLKTVLTSRRFLEKAKLPPPEGAVYLEDLSASFGLFDRVFAYWAALAMPACLLIAWTGANKVKAGDPATLIFSSGSTSVPKAVVLSHHNILSNLESLDQIFWVTEKDVMAGVLPFFHSFGFTVTLWFPLLSGFRSAHHPSPLDAKAVGALVREEKATFLIGTPTFYQGWVRRCEKGDFESLRFPMAGAEKLRPEVAKAFREKFDKELLEGYGSTEMSPVVAVNTADYDSAHQKQRGHKPGTVGQPLPGVAVKIVDPGTYDRLPLGHEGLLLVKGPNRMTGYLGDPGGTSAVLRDGWYVTGDLAQLDGDGFLTLTGRLSRFSKIAGEMVPHGKVEHALMDLIHGHGFAVTGVPDPSKGERLVVLHTHAELNVEQLLKGLAERGLPNLWIPKRDSFFFVESLPMLGSGKLDLRALQMTALGLGVEGHSEGGEDRAN